jgi:hypothetical protein
MVIQIHWFLSTVDYKNLVAQKTGNLDIQIKIVEVLHANQ